MARALLNRPELLILDEPTTGLDPQSRHQVWERLEELRADGLSILLTTHYMDEASRLCDRLIIMDQGRLLVEGKPADLVRRHVGRHVIEVADPAEGLPAFLRERGVGLREPRSPADRRCGGRNRPLPGDRANASARRGVHHADGDAGGRVSAADGEGAARMRLLSAALPPLFPGLAEEPDRLPAELEDQLHPAAAGAPLLPAGLRRRPERARGKHPLSGARRSPTSGSSPRRSSRSP